MTSKIVSYIDVEYEMSNGNERFFTFIEDILHKNYSLRQLLIFSVKPSFSQPTA
ncbi:hypothetical protein [Neobacillus endophyticus]|uniref:hypothetical protein n=1 Tax=Neobacillus endophyticus TaxID=2738405 RepID=UPI001C256237|nr:hypothetical protein [Neobacillus endophyticus]